MDLTNSVRVRLRVRVRVCIRKDRVRVGVRDVIMVRMMFSYTNLYPNQSKGDGWG